MEATIYQSNEGHTYIVFQVFHSNNYGIKRVYHILTDNDKWCSKIVDAIMNDGSITKGLWQMRYDKSKSFADYLKPYHTLRYKDNAKYQEIYPGIAKQYHVDLSGYYEYTYTQNYDD